MASDEYIGFVWVKDRPKERYVIRERFKVEHIPDNSITFDAKFYIPLTSLTEDDRLLITEDKEGEV